MKPHEYVETYEGILEQVRASPKLKSLSKREQVDVAIAILQEVGKDIRQEAIGHERNSEPATEKQVGLLNQLKIQHGNITKKEASRLIDNYYKQQKGKK